jgi:hypothetical protein
MTVDRSRAEVSVDPLALIHRVADPERTGSVLTGALGFLVQERGEDGSVVVDNGALRLRLARREGSSGEPPEPEEPLELEAETEDLDGAVETLRHRAEVLDPGEEHRPTADRIERRVLLAEGLAVRLVRILTEDDLGVLPPLPATLAWEEASDLLVRRVLRSVPPVFRPAARKRVTRRAEAVALGGGAGEVGLESAVRGLVEATPSFQHKRLLETLEAEGVEVPPSLLDLLDVEVSNAAR